MKGRISYDLQTVVSRATFSKHFRRKDDRRRIFDHKKDTYKDVKSVLIGNLLISLLMLIIAIDNFGLDGYAVFTSLGIIAYTAVSSVIVLDVVKNKPVRGNASDQHK